MPYVVDITADLNDDDGSGEIWALLDEARDPSQIEIGALVVAGREHAAAMCEVTACCRSSMSYTKMPSSLFISGSTSRGTAMSMKNMGRFLRRLKNISPCSRLKMATGAPVEVITISARSQVL